MKLKDIVAVLLVLLCLGLSIAQYFLETVAFPIFIKDNFGYIYIAFLLITLGYLFVVYPRKNHSKS